MADLQQKPWLACKHIKINPHPLQAKLSNNGHTEAIRNTICIVVQQEMNAMPNKNQRRPFVEAMQQVYCQTQMARSQRLVDQRIAVGHSGLHRSPPEMHSAWKFAYRFEPSHIEEISMRFKSVAFLEHLSSRDNYICKQCSTCRAIFGFVILQARCHFAMFSAERIAVTSQARVASSKSLSVSRSQGQHPGEQPLTLYQVSFVALQNM